MEPSLPPSSPVHQESQCPVTITSWSRNSSSPASRFDQSDREESIFPETARQLEAMFKKASEGWQKAGEAPSSEPQVVIDQSKLIILEDHFTVMQKRNEVLITENESLRNRAKKLLEKNRQLEESLSKNSPGNSVIFSDDDASGSKKIKQQFEDRGSSTIDSPEKTVVDMGIQVSTDEVCHLCQQMFQPSESLEATATITKSELDVLIGDMRRLKEAVVSRESDLERAIERENSYRVQLKRLAAETITTRQLSDSRHTELERLAETLTETERELKMAQKEISMLKKNIRQDKKHRELMDGKCTNDGSSHKGEKTGSDMFDNESKGIEDSTVQSTSGKNIRPRSTKRLTNNDKVMYSSGLITTSDRTINEPLTVTEILTKF